MGLRDRILDAAAGVLNECGHAAATTKEIARVAGCSEGSLYTYFATKELLLHAVMSERLPPFIPLIHTLLARAGEETLAVHLEELARLALAFYAAMLPMAAAVLATPELADGLRRQNLGPHRANEGLVSYLRLEQRLGRVRAGANLDAAAALLLGACQQRALNQRISAPPSDAAEEERFVTEVVATLLQGLAPTD